MSARRTASKRPPPAPSGVRPSPAAKDDTVPEGPTSFRRPGGIARGPTVEYDVTVVGGGPAGTETGRRLAEAGLKVVVLEEHLDLGSPVQCAGLVATHTFKLIGLDPHGPFHQQEVRGGHIVAPNGRRLLLSHPEVHAHAVDRAGFDRALAARAEAAGCEIVRGAVYVDSTLRHEPSREMGDLAPVRDVIVHQRPTADQPTRRTVLTCRLLVGADGVGSEVARTCGFPGADEVLSGLEIELEGLDIPDPENVHVHTGSDIAPGFFAWIVPKGRHGARVGLCIDVTRGRGKSALHYYHRYLERPDVAKLVAGGHEVNRIVGCIPLGLRARLVDDGVMLVGDAGGFAKPTSGGGIYMATWGAKELAEVAVPALLSARSDRISLLPYEKRVWGSIGRELSVGEAMRRVFRRMSDAELDTLLEKLDDPKVVATINRHGDIDHPSRLVLPLVARRPSLLRYAWPATRELVRGWARRT
ncbi:MAG: NAD(P)/FAD-dependent oxidoreductase [Euryarchaeota archaeon]|nr:NAD(P)/FAD-dependent oxidoreductase [Euryarchaeota archaeon]